MSKKHRSSKKRGLKKISTYAYNTKTNGLLRSPTFSESVVADSWRNVDVRKISGTNQNRRTEINTDRDQDPYARAQMLARHGIQAIV